MSVTMQALRRAGVLLSDRWFAMIEWQENGWPHWHVLVEAGFVPVEKVRDAWNVNLCNLGEQVIDPRTGFGSVRFSEARFADPPRAAGYACAYLSKHPKLGYPRWVLDSPNGKVHRYSTSRGFWAAADAGAGEGSQRAGGDSVLGDKGFAAKIEVNKPEPRQRRTIAQQLESCGRATAILQEIDWVDEQTGELSSRLVFIRRINLKLADVLANVEHRRPNRCGTQVQLLGNPASIRAPA